MMNPKQIIGAIQLATGKRVEDLAVKHDYTKPTFYRVISGKTTNSPVRQIIATTIGKSVDEIWPTQDK